MNRSLSMTVVVVLSICSCGSGTGSFALVNKADEPIAHAVVTICDQSSEFRNVEPGHSTAGCYTVRGDDHYVIEIEFGSGRKLRKEVGYVTSGMDFQDEIVVGDSDITLNSKGQTKYTD